MTDREKQITETLTAEGWSIRWHGPPAERWLIAEAPGGRVTFHALPKNGLRLVQMHGAGTVSQLLLYVTSLNRALNSSARLELGEAE